MNARMRFLHQLNTALGMLVENRQARLVSMKTRVEFYVGGKRIHRKVWSFLMRNDMVSVTNADGFFYEVALSNLGISIGRNTRWLPPEPKHHERQHRMRSMLEMAHADLHILKSTGAAQDIKKIRSDYVTAWDMVRICPAAGMSPDYVLFGRTMPQENLISKYRPPAFAVWARETRRRVRDAMTMVWLRNNLPWPIDKGFTIHQFSKIMPEDLWSGVMTNQDTTAMRELVYASQIPASFIWCGLRLDVPKNLA